MAPVMFYNKLKLQQKKTNAQLRTIRTQLAWLAKCQQNDQGLSEQSVSYLSVLKLIANKKILLPREQEQAQQFVHSLLNMFFQSLMQPVDILEEDPALDPNKSIGLALKCATEQYENPYDEELLPDPMDDQTNKIYCDEHLEDDSSNSERDTTFCVSSKDVDDNEEGNNAVASEEVESIYQTLRDDSATASPHLSKSNNSGQNSTDSSDLIDSSLLPETPPGKSFSRPVYWDQSTAAQELEQMSNGNSTTNQFDFNPRMSFASSTPALAPQRRIALPRVSPLGPDQAQISPATSTQSTSPEQPTVIAVTPTTRLSRTEDRLKRMNEIRRNCSESLETTLIAATGSPKSAVRLSISEKKENFDEPRPGSCNKNNVRKSRALNAKGRTTVFKNMTINDTTGTSFTQTTMTNTALNLTSRSNSTRYSLRSTRSINYKY